MDDTRPIALIGLSFTKHFEIQVLYGLLDFIIFYINITINLKAVGVRNDTFI